MSIQKSFFGRLFSRKPKQAILPLQTTEGNIADPFAHFVPATPKETPRSTDEEHIDSLIEGSAPRKRCAYIPTNESPWAVISNTGEKWKFSGVFPTRAEARNLAKSYHQSGYKARVVRAIIPTR